MRESRKIILIGTLSVVLIVIGFGLWLWISGIVSVPSPTSGSEGGTVSSPTNPSGPDFTISATPSSISFQQGFYGTPIELTVTSQNGFSGEVSLSITDLPPRATAEFGSSLINLPSDGQVSTTLTIGDPNMISPSGTYTVTIIATSGDLYHSIPITVTVEPMVH